MIEPPKVITESWVNWGCMKWQMSANCEDHANTGRQNRGATSDTVRHGKSKRGTKTKAPTSGRQLRAMVQGSRHTADKIAPCKAEAAAQVSKIHHHFSEAISPVISAVCCSPCLLDGICGIQKLPIPFFKKNQIDFFSKKLLFYSHQRSQRSQKKWYGTVAYTLVEYATAGSVQRSCGRQPCRSVEPPRFLFLTLVGCSYARRHETCLALGYARVQVDHPW
jgi:hypothetical protein